MIGDGKSTEGTGGMGAKCNEAHGFALTGGSAVIAHGLQRNVLHLAAHGQDVGTRFGTQ